MIPWFLDLARLLNTMRDISPAHTRPSTVSKANQHNLSQPRVRSGLISQKGVSASLAPKAANNVSYAYSGVLKGKFWIAWIVLYNDTGVVIVVSLTYTSVRSRGDGGIYTPLKDTVWGITLLSTHRKRKRKKKTSTSSTQLLSSFYLYQRHISRWAQPLSVKVCAQPP